MPKGPYLACVSIAGRALLAGYPRYGSFTFLILNLGKSTGFLKVRFVASCCNIIVVYYCYIINGIATDDN